MFTRIELNPPAPVRDLVLAALETDEGAAYLSGGGDAPGPRRAEKAELADQAVALLVGSAPLLLEYFSVEIVAEAGSPATLAALPALLPTSGSGATPPMDAALPLFLLRLAADVDFEQEAACFEGVARELGRYYASLPEEVGGGGGGGGGGDEAEGALPPGMSRAAADAVQFTLYPAFRAYLAPPAELVEDEQSFVAIAALEKLYKVFERSC